MTGHSISHFKASLEQRKGERKILNEQHKESVKNHKTLKIELVEIEKAQIIIQQVALETQNELKYHIHSLISLALSSVFGPDSPKFEMEFMERRNKTEADLYLVDKNGNRFSPLDERGGGIVDVCSFALQICFWSLQNPRSRNTLVFDEPLKFLKGNDLPEKGAEMIKQLSEKLNLQIIMISHIPTQIESADKVFEITQDTKGVSHVTE